MPIVYQDDHLVVVDKPAGMLVHRGWANDRVVAMTEARNAVGRWVYPVHRLDRPTSGVVVFALSKEAAASLSEAFAQRRVHKRYVALTRGITPEQGRIDHPVPRTTKGRRVKAVTDFNRLGTFERYSLVQALPLTGRLHQIRRHLKHISHPLIGDVNYGRSEHNRLFRERYEFHRMALHAFSLTFPHPAGGAELTVTAAVSGDLLRMLRAVGLDGALPATAQSSEAIGA